MKIRNYYLTAAFLGLSVCLLSGCREKQTGTGTPLPPAKPLSFPEIALPADNPLTPEKIALGKRLFNDPVLSKNKNVSCSSCHIASLAFSDSVALSLGTHGTAGMRNAPLLVNVAYRTSLFKDGGIESLELQVLAPFDNKDEFDLAVYDAVGRLLQDKQYIEDFRKAFDTLPSVYGLTRAIAAYERTLISSGSSFDRFLNGDSTAISPGAIRGWEVFNRLNCQACHSGFLFTNQTFENIGLYETYRDTGLARITFKKGDAGKFVVPTLRNIALTAPYMHDGSIKTLEEVIEFYATGGENHPNKSPLVKPFDITQSEKENLLAFLKSLTDTSFIRSVK